jgi:hypothetical protein
MAKLRTKFKDIDEIVKSKAKKSATAAKSRAGGKR